MRSSDYTRLKQRENKLWEFGGIAIPGGLSTTRAAVGAVLFLLCAGIAALVGQLSGSPVVGVVGVLLAMGVGVLGYFWAGRPNADLMTVPQRLAVMLDYTFAQPRRISGFSRDTEPDEIHWQAIIWEPRGEDWLVTREVYAEHYRSRGVPGPVERPRKQKRASQEAAA